MGLVTGKVAYVGVPGIPYVVLDIKPFFIVKFDRFVVLFCPCFSNPFPAILYDIFTIVFKKFFLRCTCFSLLP
jgi:hypothetical protein